MEMIAKLVHHFGLTLTHNQGVVVDVGVGVITIICVVGSFKNFNLMIKHSNQVGPTVIRALGFMLPILGVYLGFFFREGDENKGTQRRNVR